MHSLSIDVTTANICGNPLRPKRFVRRRMRRALRQPGVIFGQEVARSNQWRRNDYSAMWRAVAQIFGKVTVGGPREVPISVPAGWELLGSDSIEVHEGRRRVSPARYITVARYVAGGHRVAFVNCHPVSKPRRGVFASRWRIAHWDEYHEELVRIAAELHAEGYTVVFGGDMNKRLRAIPDVHPRQQLLISSGLDHLWIVPAEGVSVRITRSRKIRRTLLMDHPILSVTLELEDVA